MEWYECARPRRQTPHTLGVYAKVVKVEGRLWAASVRWPIQFRMLCLLFIRKRLRHAFEEIRFDFIHNHVFSNASLTCRAGDSFFQIVARRVSKAKSFSRSLQLFNKCLNVCTLDFWHRQPPGRR